VVLMAYHQIIGVHEDVGGLEAAASTAGKPGADVGLQAVEGDMRQQGRPGTPVPRPGLGREPRALVTCAGLEPGCELASQAGTGVDLS
jgi:hypothetical protein